MILRAMPAGVFIPLAGFTKPDRSKRRGQTKSNTWPSRLGVGRGVNNSTPKKVSCYRNVNKGKTRHLGLERRWISFWKRYDARW
jgi:hypothetical protein